MNTPSQASAPTAPPQVDPQRTWCENLAQTKWGSYMTAIETQALLEASSLAGPPGTAMELGCDGGRWSILLNQQGWKNVCTDIVPNAVATAQRRLPDAKCFVVQPSDSRLPVDDGSIDLLLVYEAPAVAEADWFPTEARRVLRKDGILIFTYLNSRSYRAMIYRVLRGLQQIWGGERFKDYYNGPSYPELRNTLAKLGFRILKESGFCWFPFGRQSNSALIGPATWLETKFGLRNLPNHSPWTVAIARLEG
jgi:SAM-dependent methyltransferase